MSSNPAEKEQGAGGDSALTYTQKVLIAVGVSLGAVLLALFLLYAAHILVLCFAGVLFAVCLSAPSDLLAQHTGIKRAYALGIVLIGLLVLVVGGVVLVGRTVVVQAHQLKETVPPAWEQLEADLDRMLPMPAEKSATMPATAESGVAAIGPATTPETQRRVQGWLRQARETATEFLLSESFVRRAGGLAGGVVSSALGVLGSIVIVLGVGLFFAIHPRMYSQGLVRLCPLPRRARASAILSKVGTQLEWWFVGQLCSMASIGLLTLIGLKILGVPMALTLAILAGLMNFIPNFGPIIAAVPAVLVAFAPHEGQEQFSIAAAGWVIGLYVVIQLLEGWVITPFFQQRAVELPPALIIVSQVVFALLLGPIGLILATPILASVLVLVRMVYIEDVLGDRGK